MQVPEACFSILVLTFFKHFVCLGFSSFSVFFFKVNFEVFLHNRVVTLVTIGVVPPVVPISGTVIVRRVREKWISL